MADQSSSIRHLYFYLVSFIALGFVVGSAVYVLNYVAKASVFTNAEYSYRGIPPAPVLIDVKSGGIGTVQCETACSLSESDRLSLQNWQEQYEQWQAQPTASASRSRGLVNALSFLIVALPVFWFHFRTAQRDFHAESAQPQPDPKRAGRTIRTFYFYLVALAAVVMFIISAAVTVNTSLKTWLLDEGTGNTQVAKPVTSSTSETQGVTSLLACADTCNVNADLKAQLTQWQADYDQAKAEMDSQQSNDWQRTLATSIPFLLASLPLFWLHWRVIQQERKIAQQ